LTQNNKIMLQQRGHDFVTYRDYLCEFGGKIEADELPIQALTRELNEELGAIVDAADVTYFGAITEAMSEHTELVHTYFWHDKKGTISGCYEGTAKYFDDVSAIFPIRKKTDCLRWLLEQCQQNGLLK